MSLIRTFRRNTSLTTKSEKTAPPNTMIEIESLHLHALSHLSNFYKDPATGFSVMTEHAHLNRGVCCGNTCRHCPYGWERTKGPDRKRVVKSGDKVDVERRLEELRRNSVPKKGCGGCDHSDKDNETDESSSESEDSSSESEDSTTGGKRSSTPVVRVRSKKRTGGRHGGTLTSKNVPYTRTGDAGSSSLFSGQRRRKDHALFACMGDVDELCTIVGVAHALLIERGGGVGPYGGLSGELLDIMSRLFDIGAVVARIPGKKAPIRAEDDDFEVDYVPNLEKWIDTMTEELPQLESFLLPSGSVLSAQLHVCRTVVSLEKNPN